jgi:S1-C subfamily serine protease
MRKALLFGIVAVVGAVAMVVLALAIAPVVKSQGRLDDERIKDRRVIMLDGRGSSIGVSIRDLEADEAAKTQGASGGVLIEEVDPESPAQKAGIRKGDVIVEFDGERVRSARHFARLVQETADGRPVKATLVRDGARQTVDVAPERATRAMHDLMLPPHWGEDLEREIERGMRALPRNFAFDFNWNYPDVSVLPRGRLGAQLTPLTDQLAGYFGAKDGVLVTSVDSESLAAKAGLKAGDVITTINGRTVGNPREVAQELRDAADDRKEVEIGIVRDKKAMTLRAQIPEARRPISRLVRPA